MSRDEAIKELLKPDESTNERIERIENLLMLIAEVIVLPQKDAALIAGVSTNTIRNKFNRGEIEILQADGSRLNFLTLKETAKLKPRRKR